MKSCTVCVRVCAITDRVSYLMQECQHIMKGFQLFNVFGVALNPFCSKSRFSLGLFFFFFVENCAILPICMKLHLVLLHFFGGGI